MPFKVRVSFTRAVKGGGEAPRTKKVQQELTCCRHNANEMLKKKQAAPLRFSDELGWATQYPSSQRSSIERSGPVRMRIWEVWPKGVTK